uniref:EF-hand domain-containing protein n=1 Tax=Panagrolaimus sp. PS1159 TaxID=55785 RepID=A0AC35F0W2_9BILA
MTGLIKAECCGSSGFAQCNGKGPCNIFCCNCDDGCKGDFTSSRLRSKTADHILAAKDIFKAADKDNNGSVTFEEAVEYVIKHNIGKKEKLEKDRSWFTKMDKNKDGKITPIEFDPSFIKH